MDLRIPLFALILVIILAFTVIILILLYLILKECSRIRQNALQYDELTGLYTRKSVANQIRAALCRIGPLDKGNLSKKMCDAFLLLDLDFFKFVNDNFGHPCGDKLLSEFAKILQKYTRTTDLVGRIGGDEFIIYLHRIKSKDTAVKKAEELLQALSETAAAVPEWNRVTASIGIALVPFHGSTFEDLYGRADTALYEAKRRGKNQVVLYQESYSS